MKNVFEPEYFSKGCTFGLRVPVVLFILASDKFIMQTSAGLAVN